MSSTNRIRRIVALALATVALLALTAVPSALAASPIEAVWAFNGGQVAIIPNGDGTYSGIVDGATTFATCQHAVGEGMWTQIRQQPDGSFWGLHQWFFESAGCTPNPALGPTAWRVIGNADGSRFLIVCFSSPGTEQPMIAPDGTHTHVTYGCYDSSEIAPVPSQPDPASTAGVAAFKDAVVLPSSARCVSHRVFTIHLRDPRFDQIKEAVVRLRGRRVAVRRRDGRLSSTIDLRGLPRGVFTVSIRLTTVLGHHIAGRRVYHTCVRAGARTQSKRGHSGSA
ncbi:MAG TPA: hypothetical protein VGG08_07270 [Solirubrobacteraceae bacterium]|jgi:hypothetical protein